MYDPHTMHISMTCSDSFCIAHMLMICSKTYNYIEHGSMSLESTALDHNGRIGANNYCINYCLLLYTIVTVIHGQEIISLYADLFELYIIVAGLITIFI